MKESRFSVDISTEKYLDYYQGSVTQVIVTTDNGKRIQFPAGALRKYVTHMGIKGNFRILYSDDNKFIRIERV